MEKEQFNFYDPTAVKIYNLDQNIKYQLSVLNNLDSMTKRHSENVGNLTCRICQYLRLNKDFTIYATICGYLHDIGKMFIPKEILTKPGALTDEEYEVIKSHTTLGYEFCMKDLQLRPYAAGALYHHEALNGTGYPQGLTKKDIPFVGRVIRVADEYDALVTKRHYTTHVNISEMLKDMIKDANPQNYTETIALDHLSKNSRVGKISPKILKSLFRVVIDDILYEITGLINYIAYIKDNIKRLETIDSYNTKANNTDKEKKKNYYKEGMKLLFQAGETEENFKTILKEYQQALIIRETRIDALYNEIKIIKKLKI